MALFIRAILFCGLYELAENRTQTPNVIVPVLLSVLFYPSVEFNTNIFFRVHANRNRGARRRALFLNYWSERVVLARGNKDEIAEPPGRKFLRLASRVPAAEIRPATFSALRRPNAAFLKLRSVELGNFCSTRKRVLLLSKRKETYRWPRNREFSGDTKLCFGKLRSERSKNIKVTFIQVSSK